MAALAAMRADDAQDIAPAERRPGRAVTIFLCGDVMLGRGVDQVLPYPGDPRLYESYVGSALGYVQLAERVHGPIHRPLSFGEVWGDALDELRRVGPDIRFINLETAITRSDAHAPKGINYRMSPENAGCLASAGISGCALANNHVLDWGEAGLLETLKVLERLDIASAGAGRSLVAARAPAIMSVQGKDQNRGRVIAFSCALPSSGVPPEWAATPNRAGVNLLPDLTANTVDQIAQQVRAVRRPGDVVILSLHWGPNWGYAIPDEHRRFAHALIERADISIVHGHSSHHPIAFETYRNRLILYGCGDFINDYEGIAGYEEFRNDLTLMYFATVDADTGSLLGLEMTPLQIRRLRLNHATREDVMWLQRTLDRECRRFGGKIDLGPQGRLVLSLPQH